MTNPPCSADQAAISSSDEGPISGISSHQIAIAIPCLNEEVTIGEVVQGFRNSLPQARIVVFDNASSDSTVAQALEAGAEVIEVPQRGKGNVVRAALEVLVADGAEVVLLVDGDATYDPIVSPTMVTQVLAGSDLVYATRIGSGDGRYRPGHELGNRLLRLLHVIAFGTSPNDPLTGYRAMGKRFAEAFPAKSRGFSIETEMNLFALSREVEWTSVEAPYFARPEGSASKLSTYRDGARILLMALRGSFAAFDQADERGADGVRPRQTLSGLGALLTAAVYAAGAVLACTVFFLLANLWWVRAEDLPLEGVLRQALPISTTSVAEQRQVDESQPESRRNDALLRDSPEAFNDCLIPIMALEKQGSQLELMVSARRVYRFSTPQRPCDALEQLLHQGRIDPDDYLTVFYHSYWNGQRVLLRAFAPVLGIAGLRAALRGATWLLIGAGALLALLGVVRGPPQTVVLRLGVLAMLIAFAASGDLPRRAASFTSAPSNILCLVFLLGFGLHPRGLLALHRRTRVLTVAAFGALLGYLALFFGTVLIGFVFVLLLVALTPLSHNPPPPMAADSRRFAGARWRLLVEMCAAVFLAIAGTLIVHAMLAAAVFDGALAAVIDQLHHRMTGDARTTMHPALNVRYAGEHVSWTALLQRLDSRIDQVGLGSATLGRIVVLGSSLGTLGLCALRLWAGRMRDSKVDTVRWLALLLASLAVPAWYALFREHTITHVGNMVRLLFLTVGVAASALVCWWFEERSPPAPTHSRQRG